MDCCRLSHLLFVVHVAVMAVGAMAGEAPKIVAGAVERYRTGFQFTEGPAWDGRGTLYFSDVPAGIIYQIDSAGKLSKFVEPSHHSNGLLKWGEFLYVCEMDGSIARYRLGDAGSREVIASQFAGARFNAPNDLVVDQKGGVYFTDPEFRAPKPLPQKGRGVFYVSPDGKVSRLVEEHPNPNGIILSTDEKKLYVVPSSASTVALFDVNAPGELGPLSPGASLRQPPGQKNSGGDGCTIDTEGWLYVTTGVGIQVISPEGQVAEVIEVPEVPSNVTFGGPDLQTLYITARTSVYRVATHRKGYVFGPP
jgi:gluconolactonase